MDSKTAKIVGEIVSVDDSTINLLFEIKTETGGELLIPANENLIKEIDKEQQMIEVEIPDGLLDL